MGLLFLRVLFLWLLLGVGTGFATEIEVDYSYRVLAEGWDEPSSEEGTILATLTSSAPVSLLIPDESIVQLGTRRFTRIFHWDETDTVHAVFIDQSGQEIPLHLFPEPHFAFDPGAGSVPVIRLLTEPVNLWDVDTGIYVYGLHINWSLHGDQWERPATFEYWDSEGNIQISREAGIRISGGNSRSYQQKSFRIYFDHEDDEPEFIAHDFFNAGEENFSRLLARCGMYPHRLMFDTWANSLFADMGHETSRIQFISLYLNREYWGCFNLRERLDDEWLEITRGIDKDDFILIKDGETENGNGQLWGDFLDWVAADQDYSSHDFFQRVSGELNLEAYIDWLIINIFGASSDTGFHANLALVKIMNEPWEFVMWDEDSILSDENAQENYFRFFSATSQQEFNTWHPANYHIWDYEIARPFFLLFNHLMQNAQFRTIFSYRFDERMTGLMGQRAMQERLQGIAATQIPELDRHSDKYWDGTLNSYYSVLNSALDWIPARSSLVRQQKTEFMDLFMATVELSEFSVSEENTGHQLQWRTESESDCLGFSVQQALHPDGPFITLADYQSHPALLGAGSSGNPANYSFLVENPEPADVVYYRLTHTESGGQEVVHSWTEAIGTPVPEPPVLLINELMALNSSGITDENGQYEDWVEIFNPGSETVDLEGMFLTDDPVLDTRWQFPAGTSLDPGQFLLVWCDSDPEDGPMHASFKLSGAGEQCALFSSLAHGHQLIDSVTFGAQNSDISYGRIIDGGVQWDNFENPTPGSSNNPLSRVNEAVASALPWMTVYPNPFNPVINIELEISPDSAPDLNIYDSAGRLVRILNIDSTRDGLLSLQWDGLNGQGRMMPAGVYLLRLSGKSGVIQRKITLLK